MIVKTFVVTLILSVGLISDVIGASYSNVFVERDYAPSEYYQYGAPHASIASPRISQIHSLPGYVSPCAPPCVLPGQTIASVVPVNSNANVVTYNAPTPNVPVVITPNKEEGAGYQYHYVVYDENTGDHKAQRELSDGSVVRGEYSFMQPDGYIREVQYVADDVSGFNAVVKHFLPANVNGKRKGETKLGKDAPPCHEVKNESIKKGSGHLDEHFGKHSSHNHEKLHKVESKEHSKHGSEEESSEESKEKNKHKAAKESQESEEESKEKHHTKSKNESGEEESSVEDHHKKPKKESKKESEEESDEHLKVINHHTHSKKGSDESEEDSKEKHHKSKKESKESGEESEEESESEESNENSSEHSKGKSKEKSGQHSEHETKEHSHGNHHSGYESNKPDHEVLVPYNDIVRCIQQALSRAQGAPPAMRQEPSALTYLLYNRPC